MVVAQFFAGTDLPQADQPQPRSDRPKRQVGVATVIDQFGPVTARGTVNRPVGIEPSQVVQASASPWRPFQKAPSRFPSGDSFSRILNDFASRRDILCRKHTEPVNSRAANV
jgi:hypothetical protein